ncbi:MAG: alpha/beta fold hydrolase [Pseudomonadota bacterium]
MRVFLVLIAIFGLASCVDRTANPVVPQALNFGTPVTVFAASSREQEADGSFGYDRAAKLSLLEMTVTIPPTHTPGSLAFSYADPDPSKQFALAGQQEFDTLPDFRRRLSSTMKSRARAESEVLIFVHGYNSTQTETAFRAAQMAHDMDIPGQPMIYSWPSRAKAFGYAYDLDSILFARDGLETFIREVKASGVERVVLVAHSMGSVLTMEMLRQAEIREPGWADRTFSGIVLISPDLDIDLFRKQMSAIRNVPENFVVLVSGKDKILNISARLRGTADSERLGNISSIEKVADLPIEVVDMTEFNADAQSSHFVAATSPSLIAMFKSINTVNENLGREDRALASLIPPSQRNPGGATQIHLNSAAVPPGESR